MTTPGSPPNWPALGRGLTTRADTTSKSWRTPAQRRAAAAAGEFAAAREADAANVPFLGETIVRYGWPGRPQVGEPGCQAAVAIAVHADQDSPLQSRFLATLRKAAQRVEATPAPWAHVQHRMLGISGRPQLYGTQYAHRQDGAGGRLELLPVAEPDALDRRRAHVGLSPHGEQAQRLHRHHSAPLSAPVASTVRLAERPAP
ncbi:DUF6624 domain-containing protein [Streptomyces longwoodensis]|uniref:DUF6624 domain-containing protein n=1 Tax=Streptomyces longwoodensis TaxID=68231 RepID=UPI0033B285EA